jgi:putative endonuclease
MSTRETGLRGEAIAAGYLRKKGYKLLESNYATRYGEIDIIADDKKCLVFVEVKFRASSAFGGPADAVDKKKQAKMIKSALSYVKARKLSGRDIRFDVLALGPAEGAIELIKDAFSSGGGYTL